MFRIKYVYLLGGKFDDLPRGFTWERAVREYQLFRFFPPKLAQKLFGQLAKPLLVAAGDFGLAEGVAAAEVLKVGSRGAEQTESAVRENASGLWVVITGAVVSGATDAALTR